MDAAAALYVEGGPDAVSIASVASRLDVSRATLYRTVPTKEDLLGALFESSTGELTALARSVIDGEDSAEGKLAQLIELHVHAAIRMRLYMPVFFGGAGLPSDVLERWHRWSREYEDMWAGVVADAMDDGALTLSDVTVAAREILGMCIWVSRWYRDQEGIEPDAIVEGVIALVLR